SGGSLFRWSSYRRPREPMVALLMDAGCARSDRPQPARSLSGLVLEDSRHAGLQVVQVVAVEDGGAVHRRAGVRLSGPPPRSSSPRKAGWASAMSARTRSTSLSADTSAAPCSVTTHCTWWRAVVTHASAPSLGTMVEMRWPCTVAVDLRQRRLLPPGASDAPTTNAS